jgi:ATP adenylyltransferase
MSASSRTFLVLHDFIENKMRMAHVYQPLMLTALLERAGAASTPDIAKALLIEDISQIDYYSHRIDTMVGKVLRSHDLVSKMPRQPKYTLNGYEELSDDEVSQLIHLCHKKLTEFKSQRGDEVWEHRSRNRKAVSGTIRYEVLKRANYRCELCGINAKDKALEVDHIVPKSLGGKDDLTNYQSLCYSCNASKGNRDNTNLKAARIDYDHRQNGCLFCDAYHGREVVAENTLAYAIRDGFPVTDGHMLIIPKRHVGDYFGLSTAEVSATHQLLHQLKASLSSDDATITGFNIGMNAGESAGQTVFHCHTHLIPRRDGDVENPRGGVRHVIKGKGNY